MRKRIVASIATLLAGTGLAMAQSTPSIVSDSHANPTNSGSIPNVNPSLLGGGQSSEPAAKKKDDGAVSELPPAPFDPGCGVWVPNGPNAFSAPEPKHSPLDLCGPNRFWVRGDFLLWWVREQPVPGPLVTTGTAASQGALGPGTTILSGDGSLDYGPLVGGRLFVGISNCDHTWAIEGGGLLLETGSTTFQAASDPNGNPVLGRPFVDVLNGNAENAAPVSLPGAFAGMVQVKSTTDLTGAEVNLWRYFTPTSSGPTIGLLVGFRYLFLQESIGVQQQTEVLPGGVAAFNGNIVLGPSTLGIADTFDTRNDFYGGQVGAQIDFHPGRFFGTVTGKLGIGNTHQVANNFGVSSLTDAAGNSTAVPGGLFAVQGNSGLLSRDEFTLVPEFAINVGVEVTANLRLFAGYTFLYWDDVMRPGSQFNRAVNTSLVPTSLNFGTGQGGPTASSQGDHTQFWAQGITASAAFRY